MKKTFALLTVLLVVVFCNQVSAFTLDAAEELPYTYDFSARYVVAGERVLNLRIHNNSPCNIDALEFEARLLDAFRDPISEWSTYSNPDLRIPSDSTGLLTLTLNRQNILGVNVENVLDKARFFELRYTRILLEDGTLLRAEDLYPNTEKLYGPYRLELEILNGKQIEDNTKYNFERVDVDTQSNLYKYISSFPWGERERFDSMDTIDEIASSFSDRGIVLLVRITNASDKFVEKYWSGSYSPIFILLDEAMHQYSSYALLYAPQVMKGLVYNGPQIPGVTLTLVYVFDKFNDYDPQQIQVYIEGERYPQTFEVYPR